jgi:hypothetical protein
VCSSYSGVVSLLALVCGLQVLSRGEMAPCIVEAGVAVHMFVGCLTQQLQQQHEQKVVAPTVALE